MTNRLAREKSPYLLQHAENPVDWYPWGEEAFEKARKEDKPVFLSIGYSTCHWCHVMEEESFEDKSVAQMMNDAFVSIKVDREERPDIDQVYMTACQLMTGSGGWPLTIIMTPDKKPFFAGTYFPRENRAGRIGMFELIQKIHDFWKKDRSRILESAEHMTQALENAHPRVAGGAITEEILHKATEDFRTRYDAESGGFGNAPKFPTPHNFYFLLRYASRFHNPQAAEMVTETLLKMRRGGVFDQIGFGFHRYSTDPVWLLPHFEKMLYDQALMAIAYLEAYQTTRDEQFADVAREIFTYVLRDMTSPDGGFFSAEDADSEGEEGKFYTWTIPEIRAALSTAEAETAIRTFSATPDGNFEEQGTGLRTERNILHLAENPPGSIENIRQKLFAAREKRIHPHKDDKILTDWNGLMIAALARGGRVLGNSAYTDAAARAAQFISNKLHQPDGHLWHRYREGEASVDGNLDDYAFLIWGLLELFQATCNSQYFEEAVRLSEFQNRDFWDEEKGLFYFTAHHAESLIARPLEISDSALPAGNSVAAQNLMLLGMFTGQSQWTERAGKILKAYAGSVRETPVAFPFLLCAADLALGGSSPFYDLSCPVPINQK